MDEWLPEEVASSRGGRELPTVSALGPFLSISVFPEEDPAVAEAHFNPPVNKATIRCGYFLFQSLSLNQGLFVTVGKHSDYAK